jgi:ubiquitin-protein ligase
MSARLRRIYADYQSVLDEFSGHPYITVTPLQGDPPETYQVEYRVKGLELDPATNRPRERNYHKATIYLHRDYPREKPKSVLETPIFHPNFGSYICIGDHWAAGETLVDIIIKIGQMITYQDYNPKSPLNAVAARWVIENERLLPIDNRDLYQPEVDLDIDLGEPEAEAEDDLGIELQ